MKKLKNIIQKLLFIVTLMSGISNATTYAPPVFKICPECYSVTTKSVLRSGNTFGAKHWTDGKIEAPMLPQTHWLVKCPDCKVLLWVDELKRLNVKNFSSLKKIVPREKFFARFLTPKIEDYYKVLDESGLSDEKEKYVRIQVWYMENDKRRDNNKTIPLTLKEQDNLILLFDLIPNDSEHYIIRAEILRELGNFDEAERILSQASEKDKKSKAFFQIMELIKQNNPFVDEIISEK